MTDDILICLPGDKVAMLHAMMKKPFNAEEAAQERAAAMEMWRARLRDLDIPRPEEYVTEGLEPGRLAMHEAAQAFTNAALGRGKPYWLTLAGRCGCGKTLLARWVRYTLLRARRPCTWVHCGEMVARAREEGQRCIQALAGEAVLVLDDFGAWHDSTGWAGNAFSTMLNARLGKWTLITTNARGRDIKAIDERLLWRLRDRGNTLVDFF